jgi:mono/diheme cytochrome c family protein
MTLARLASIVLATALLALAGCGGSDSGSSGGGGGGGGSTDQASNAQETFANTCGGCHTLKAAGTEGQVGPDLDQVKPSKQVVLDTIKEGPSVMPSNLLKGAEADAVAEYVATHAGQ